MSVILLAAMVLAMSFACVAIVSCDHRIKEDTAVDRAVNSDSAYIAHFEEHREAFEALPELLAGVPNDLGVELSWESSLRIQYNGRQSGPPDGVISTLDYAALVRANREIGASFLSRTAPLGEPSVTVSIGWRKPKYYLWQRAPILHSVFDSDLSEISSRPGRPRGPICRPLGSGWYLAESDPRELYD
jgi:hypothetical protein